MHILDAEFARREKQAGIFPEADVDLFMKVSLGATYLLRENLDRF